jgi:hypothetical protein
MDSTDSLPPQVAPTELVAKLVSSANAAIPGCCSQVASLRSVPGEESLVMIMRGGDIASMKLEEPVPQVRSRCLSLLALHFDTLIHLPYSSK